MAGLFSYVELHSHDAEKAKGFYGELFGWKFAKSAMPEATYFGIEGRDPDARGGLMKDTERAPHWLAYVNVDDISLSLTKAQRLGAKVLQPVTQIGKEGTMAVLSDPTGAVFALWQPLKG